MSIDFNADTVITRTSLREYFHTELNTSLHNLQISAKHETIHYLTNMLTVFSRSEALFEQTENGIGIKPLALTYGEALNENSTRERTRLLQKLGDTALFIAGIFSDSLKYKIVDADYYITMGGNAYASLSDVTRDYRPIRRMASIFDELTRKFVHFVDALNEVSERSHLSSNTDVLRLYELWIRTGSIRARKRLRKLGIVPLDNVRNNFRD